MTKQDRILEEVGWIAARRDLDEAMRRHGLDLTSDWLDVLLGVGIEIASRGSLPFEAVAEGLARGARHWWPKP